jgi:nitrogen fixation NifU-like protein
MANDNLYTEALMEHVQHPDYKYELADATHSHEGVNPSCGDDLILQIRMGADGRIEEAAYTGHGCAVSQASADMMSDLMVGKTPEEALELCKLFGDMVRGDETDSAKLEEQLDEAACLQSISHMPARVKCAELAWRTLEEMLKE